jgi:hypothetical protein
LPLNQGYQQPELLVGELQIANSHLHRLALSASHGSQQEPNRYLLC